MVVILGQPATQRNQILAPPPNDTAIASNFVAVFRAAGKLQGALHEFLRGALTHGGFFHVSTLGCGFFT
ncbi:MAG TPA: hypothetical protein VHY91_14865, partial [Pirellulales bacterium]|nr:hypothetical protein [Pirellulales bacterium]